MPTVRYLSSDTPTWHYEPKPVGVDKLMFLCADGQLRIGYQKGWQHGRDYVAWAELLRYDKDKFNEVLSAGKSKAT